MFSHTRGNTEQDSGSEIVMSVPFPEYPCIKNHDEFNFLNNVFNYLVLMLSMMRFVSLVKMYILIMVASLAEEEVN